MLIEQVPPRIEEEGELRMATVFSINLYWSGSMFDVKNGILSFYEKAALVVDPCARFYRTEWMKNAKKVDENVKSMLPFWLEDKEARRGMYSIQIDNRRSKNAASECGFRLFSAEYRGAGSISLWIPYESAQSRSESLWGWVIDLVDEFNFSFGAAGFSFAYNDLHDSSGEIESRMSSLVQRYSVVDFPCARNTMFIVGDGFKRVNWATFLGSKLVSRVGGTEALKKVGVEDISVVDTVCGIAIRAGVRPILGDVNRVEDLSHYRRVGSMLVDARSRVHPPVLVPQGAFVADRGMTQAWLSRFDK